MCKLIVHKLSIINVFVHVIVLFVYFFALFTLAKWARQSRDDDDETINFLGLELKSASGRVWKKAFEKSLDEQNMYNTAASSLVKGVLRWVAWTIFAIGVHGPEHLVQ